MGLRVCVHMCVCLCVLFDAQADACLRVECASQVCCSYIIVLVTSCCVYVGI